MRKLGVECQLNVYDGMDIHVASFSAFTTIVDPNMNVLYHAPHASAHVDERDPLSSFSSSVVGEPE